jgi:hypothetical protein
MKDEVKIGMYGETPKIQIGKYTISNMTNKENCTTVWIEDTEGGDGGEFHKDTLAKSIDVFYNKFF